MSRVIMILMLAVCICGFASCDSYDEPKDVSKNIVMEISDKTGVTGPMFGAPDVLIECMLAKERGSDKLYYLYMGEIRGFNYEKGHAYLLKVRRTKLANPPADASCYTYLLLEIISDKKVSDTAE